MKDGFDLQGLDHVAIAVRDVDAARRWYAEVLGLERRHQETWGDFPVMMAAGDTMLALFPRPADAPPDDGQGGKPALRHIAFRADRANFDRARRELARRGIDVEFQDHDIAHSIYFFDPDGYEVEITTYEL